MASYKLSSPFPAVYDHVRHTVFMVGTATRTTDSYAEFVIVVTICCCSHEWVVFVSTSRAVVIIITVIYAIIGRTFVLVAPAAVIVGASGAGSPRSAMRMRRHFPGGTMLYVSTCLQLRMAYGFRDNRNHLYWRWLRYGNGCRL